MKLIFPWAAGGVRNRFNRGIIYSPSKLRTKLTNCNRFFSIDKDVNTLPIPGCKETSLRERLSEKDQRENLAEPEIKRDEKKRGFRMVYLYENESLWELSNNTVHALMHFGWVHKYDHYFTAQLAVYAKTRGWLGDVYMKMIMPFRRHIVYPAMMDYVKAKWEAYCKKEKSNK